MISSGPARPGTTLTIVAALDRVLSKAVPADESVVRLVATSLSAPLAWWPGGVLVSRTTRGGFGGVAFGFACPAEDGDAVATLLVLAGLAAVGAAALVCSAGFTRSHPESSSRRIRPPCRQSRAAIHAEAGMASRQVRRLGTFVALVSIILATHRSAPNGAEPLRVLSNATPSEAWVGPETKSPAQLRHPRARGQFRKMDQARLTRISQMTRTKGSLSV